MIDKLIENLDITDLKNGYILNNTTKTYQCLFCSVVFEKGMVYPVNEKWLTAKRAVRHHVEQAHGEVFHQLLGLGKEHTGLSDIQQELLELIYDGFTDKQIALKLGGKSASTIRNHRFQLRKRKKEAKLFLSIMDLLEKRDKSKEDYMEIPVEKSILQEKLLINPQEEEKIRKRFFKPDGSGFLELIPRKQESRLIVFHYISQQFNSGKIYREKEVNEILGSLFHDPISLRRYLVDYKFLQRKRDGSEYWRNPE